MILDFYTNITLDILKISDKSGEIKNYVKKYINSISYTYSLLIRSAFLIYLIVFIFSKFVVDIKNRENFFLKLPIINNLFLLFKTIILIKFFDRKNNN